MRKRQLNVCHVDADDDVAAARARSVMDQERPNSRHPEASAATHSGGCLTASEKVDRVNSVMTPTKWQASKTRMLLDSGSFMH
eukprot:15629620-Heterocapsa_arctica.AAC.1